MTGLARAAPASAPDETLLSALHTPFGNIEDVVAGLKALERTLRARRDRRAIFATAYLCITREIRRGIQDGLFLDETWAARYLVAFANLYRQALLDFETGNLAAVPKSWRIAFETSSEGSALVLQDLLLGVNAHINHDLALALIEVTIDPQRTARKLDHDAVNQALRIGCVQLEESIARLYEPVLSFFDRALGPLDESFACFSVAKARENAWEFARFLAGAHDDQERAAIRARLNDNAAVLAQLILSPNVAMHPLGRGFHRLENVVPWWEHILAEGEELIEHPHGLHGQAPAAPYPAFDAEEVVHRLQQTVARLDAQRSRLALHPVLYLRMIARIRQAIAGGGPFEGGEWLEQAYLHSADGYLHALAVFEAGGSGLPRCWAAALRAAAQHETTSLQLIALWINAWLNYDLPVAWSRLGSVAGMEARDQDLQQRAFALLDEDLQDLQKLLVLRYSLWLNFPEILADSLDEILSDLDPAQAWEAAWASARAAAQEPSEERRQARLDELDRKATALAHRILVRSQPGEDWLIQGMSHAERAYDGAWSGWLPAAGPVSRP